MGGSRAWVLASKCGGGIQWLLQKGPLSPTAQQPHNRFSLPSHRPARLSPAAQLPAHAVTAQSQPTRLHTPAQLATRRPPAHSPSPLWPHLCRGRAAGAWWCGCRSPAAETDGQRVGGWWVGGRAGGPAGGEGDWHRKPFCNPKPMQPQFLNQVTNSPCLRRRTHGRQRGGSPAAAGPCPGCGSRRGRPCFWVVSGDWLSENTRQCIEVEQTIQGGLVTQQPLLLAPPEVRLLFSNAPKHHEERPALLVAGADSAETACRPRRHRCRCCCPLLCHCPAWDWTGPTRKRALPTNH